MKDLIEVQPPGRNRLLIVLCVERPRDRISFTPPLDDVLLDLGHRSMIGRLVGERPGVYIAGSTHVVNRPIASNTG